MGLPAILSNLSVVIIVVLLVVSVAMFFYFRQKISELEKASINQAKILHSFISQTLSMPRNYNPAVKLSDMNDSALLLSNHPNSNESNSSYENSSPKEKIPVSDDEYEDEDEDDSDADVENSSSDDDDDASSQSSDTTNDIKSVKLKELDDSEELLHLDTSKVKRIVLNSKDDTDLVPFDLNDFDKHLLNNQGSCASSSDELSDAVDDSLSELSDDDDGRVPNDDLSNSNTLNKSEEILPIQSILSNLNNNPSLNVNVNDLLIVKKSESHNTSLKDKEESNELKSLKVDTLRQLVIDKSLANADEAKKLKKKELLDLLAQSEEKNNI